MLRTVDWLARAMAIIGGIVLCGLILLTCVSVVGRGLNTLGHVGSLSEMAPGLAAFLTGFGPVKGDFEVVEAGIAFAIFAFLPVCQLHGGHATVDVFTNMFPRGANRAIAAFWEVVLSALIVLISWRLFVGMEGKMSNGETTYLLQFPTWWAYAASFAASIAAVIIAVYCAVARVAGLATGGDYMPKTEGPAH